MLSEFKAFLTKSNALALAVGVIIGAASGKVVSALVADILMPLIGLILPKGDWRTAQWILSQAPDPTDPNKMVINAIKYGDFLGNVVDFIAIALVVFLLTKWLLRPAPEAPTKDCPFCKEKLPMDATKCKACTSVLPD
ncbi:MAG TPA: large conductance mechanosensitive channel protein MscL [Chthonomonadaceae bacterium]|nr:large conductance mechanosensitive channel protein MscL [Chthonomonadaceae bacterium]